MEGSSDKEESSFFFILIFPTKLRINSCGPLK